MNFKANRTNVFTFFVAAYVLMFMGFGSYDATPVHGKWIRSPITHAMTFQKVVTFEGTVTFGADVTGTTTDFVAKTVTFGTEYDNGNSGTSKIIAWNNGQKQKITLTGNCTFTFTAPTGAGSFLLKLIQDGNGSRLVTWPGTVDWIGGGTAPTLTTTAAAVDFVALYYDGANYHCSAGLDSK